MTFRIEFPESNKPGVDLNAGDSLSEKLTIHNSPILFGCRIGICGTCAIEILDHSADLPPMTYDEDQFLSTMAPGRTNVRLACQIRINANMKIKKTNI